MKKQKYIFVILSVVLLTVVCAVSSGFQWEYFYAGILYGRSSSENSKLLFSKETGFYEEAFYLSIYAPTDEIFYTLDGSDPTRESLRYQSPILIEDASLHENVYSMRTDLSTGFLAKEDEYAVPEELIDKCTVLKAVYYDEFGNQSEIEERIYFVNFEKKSGYEGINILSITTDPENLFDEETGIYVLGDTYEYAIDSVNKEEVDWCLWPANYTNSGYSWEREARITVFDKERNHVLTQNVGIRIQGGASRGLNPKSLNIYARDEYGDNRLRYDFWETGYYPKRMTLSAGGNDNRGKMLDRLGSELTESCDFATMNYEPYVLFLNGEYWGFYYLTEKYDEYYIEQYYEVDHENVVIIKAGELETGREEDLELYLQMCEFAETADMTQKENYETVCELMDIQSLIDYFAAEIYMARLIDWPDSNYALWRSRETGTSEYEDGKWRWMLFDLNTASMQEEYVEHDTLERVIRKSPMFANLWTNEKFRNDFSERLLEMSETIFEKEQVLNKVSEYVQFMFEPMQKHHQRFFGKAFESKYPTAESITNFALQRAEYIPEMLKENMP